MVDNWENLRDKLELCGSSKYENDGRRGNK